MTVYLVDFENVRSEGLKGVDKLGEGDKVVIFYSKNAENISFDVHMLLSKSKAEIETFRILRGGRNSLDFQLSTYLGYLVMENCYKKIFIVSQDKGFLCAISFWEVNSDICNADIKLCKSISNAESENSTSEDYDDGLTGKFLERIEVKKQHQNEAKGALQESHMVRNQVTVSEKKLTNQNVMKEVTEKSGESSKNHNNSYKHKRTPRTAISVRGTFNNAMRSTTVKTNEEETKNAAGENSPKVNLNVQNPTSKNKIFAAEVKLNITDDIKEIIRGKYDESYVPLLVETIGKSTGKQHFYRMLVSRLGQETGHNIYMMIKGQYANLKRK